MAQAKWLESTQGYTRAHMARYVMHKQENVVIQVCFFYGNSTIDTDVNFGFSAISNLGSDVYRIFYTHTLSQLLHAQIQLFSTAVRDCNIVAIGETYIDVYINATDLDAEGCYVMVIGVEA